MKRYQLIKCPKCGGVDHIDYVYPSGWSVRRVKEYDVINDEPEFCDDGRYETVDMTPDNTPFGPCPEPFFIHHNASGGTCHQWLESDEAKKHRSYEYLVLSVLKKVYRDLTVAMRTADKYEGLIKQCEGNGMAPGRLAMTIVALEAGVEP